MNTLFKTASIEVKDFKENSFIAYASTFGNSDSYNDVMEKGCFREAVKKAKDTGKYPKLLYAHSIREVCGIISDMGEDNKGLLIEGKFINTTRGRDTHEEVKTGAIDSMSVGFYLKDYEIRDDTRYIKNLDLFEVSFVAFPANEQALVQDVKENKWSWDDETMVKHLEKRGWECLSKEAKELEKVNSTLKKLIGEF